MNQDEKHFGWHLTEPSSGNKITWTKIIWQHDELFTNFTGKLCAHFFFIFLIKDTLERNREIEFKDRDRERKNQTKSSKTRFFRYFSLVSELVCWPSVCNFFFFPFFSIMFGPASRKFTRKIRKVRRTAKYFYQANLITTIVEHR